jgi:hypothetical protein
MRYGIALIVLCVLACAAAGAEEKASAVLRPAIDGEWWQVAGDPDLGKWTSPGQQPVDFGVWQARDGTWQLWSCIRNTKCGGNTRLFYRWEGKRLTDADWKPMGIAMTARPELGESLGGLQAPHVIREGDTSLMFYGDWGHICLAESDDGKTFRRVLGAGGRPQLFSGPYGNTRDAMVMKHDGTHYCYYMGHKKEAEIQSAIFCRTSRDLKQWSDPVMVSGGGSPATQDRWYGGDAECPHVVRRHGAFYLFRNQRYGPKNLNTQYRSPDPLDFGVDTDKYMVGTLPVAAPEIIRHEGRDYIAALMPSLKGIRIARLKWVPAEKQASRDQGTK